MHYVFVMKIQKIRELQITNFQTQVRLGPSMALVANNTLTGNAVFAIYFTVKAI